MIDLPANTVLQLSGLPANLARTLTNIGSNTVYYGDRNVSATSNAGSIAPGASVQLSSSPYVVSPNGEGQLDEQRFSIQFQTAQVDCGAFTASQSKDIPVTWPIPFPDNKYSVMVTLVDTASTVNANAFRQVVGTPTPTGFTARVAAGTTGYSAGQLFLHALAIHN